MAKLWNFFAIDLMRGKLFVVALLLSATAFSVLNGFPNLSGDDMAVLVGVPMMWGYLSIRLGMAILDASSSASNTSTAYDMKLSRFTIWACLFSVILVWLSAVSGLSATTFLFLGLQVGYAAARFAFKWAFILQGIVATSILCTNLAPHVSALLNKLHDITQVQHPFGHRVAR
jgi:hypothetical protein